MIQGTNTQKGKEEELALPWAHGVSHSQPLKAGGLEAKARTHSIGNTEKETLFIKLWPQRDALSAKKSLSQNLVLGREEKYFPTNLDAQAGTHGGQLSKVLQSWWLKKPSSIQFKQSPST